MEILNTTKTILYACQRNSQMVGVKINFFLHLSTYSYSRISVQRILYDLLPKRIGVFDRFVVVYDGQRNQFRQSQLFTGHKRRFP